MLEMWEDSRSDKTHLVDDATKKSNLKQIDTCVSQGSVLGTILLLNYINELKENFLEIQRTLLSDDTSVL